MTARNKRWSLTWRLGLIVIAVALVAGSAWRMGRDACRAGPYVHDDAQSHTIDDEHSFPEFFEPEKDQVNLMVNFSALDVTNSSITTQLEIELGQSLVSQLVLVGRSASSPVNASNSSQWMRLPVTLHLLLCRDIYGPHCIGASSIQIRLGDLLAPDGRTAAATPVTRQLDLFAEANPGAFPQDKYAVTLDPEVSLPDGVKWISTSGSSFESLPINLRISRGTGLGDKRVVVLYSVERGFGYQVLVSREGLDQYLTYAMSLAPAFLGLLVLCLAFIIRQPVDSGLTVILGLLTAWLTILPLRAVLVPQELGATPLTRADDLLILDAALVLLFTVVAFIWVVPKSRH
jgi:hypothetical protein